MTNKNLCKCGHEKVKHSKGKGECLKILNVYTNLKIDDYCPCKKFQPKMIGILEMAKRIKDEDRKLAKIHSPSEERNEARSSSSGGDNHCSDFPNPTHHAEKH